MPKSHANLLRFLFFFFLFFNGPEPAGQTDDGTRRPRHCIARLRPPTPSAYSVGCFARRIRTSSVSPASSTVVPLPQRRRSRKTTPTKRLLFCPEWTPPHRTSPVLTPRGQQPAGRRLITAPASTTHTQRHTPSSRHAPVIMIIHPSITSTYSWL